MGRSPDLLRGTSDHAGDASGLTGGLPVSLAVIHILVLVVEPTNRRLPLFSILIRSLPCLTWRG